MNKVQEKASIDWNNYLSKEEVKQFLSKDDKIESAENIIYSNDFKDRFKEFKKSGWSKRELTQDLSTFYNNGHLITEGIHLAAFIRDPFSNEVKIMEDDDYNSKSDYARDLRANELVVLSVSDNRDLYLSDHSNYTKISDLKKDLNKYKKYRQEAIQANPKSTLWKNECEELKQLYDEAMKQPLN